MGEREREKDREKERAREGERKRGREKEGERERGRGTEGGRGGVAAFAFARRHAAFCQPLRTLTKPSERTERRMLVSSVSSRLMSST